MLFASSNSHIEQPTNLLIIFPYLFIIKKPLKIGNPIHILPYKWTELSKSPKITINGPQNRAKLIDLVIRIELTRAILMLLFSNFLRNSIIIFQMFLQLETCFQLLCGLQAVS